MRKDIFAFRNLRKYLIITVTIILIILGYFNYTNSKKVAIHSIQNKNTVLLDSIINSIDNFLCERECDFQDIVLIHKKQYKNLIQHLDALYKKHKWYDSIDYINSNGEVLFSTDNKNNIEDYTKYIEKSRVTKEVVISDVLKTINNNLVISIVTPLYYDDTIHGFILGNIKLSSLGNEVIYTKFLGTNNTIFGIDKNSIRILSLNENLIGKNVFDGLIDHEITTKNYQEMIMGNEVNGEHYSKFGFSNYNVIVKKSIRKLMVSKPVLIDNEFKFSLAVTTPYSITDFFDQFIFRQLLLFLLLLFVAIYFLYSLFKEYKEKNNLEKSLSDSKKSERIKTEFFCDMSHELRTPLTIILNGLHLIYSKYYIEIHSNKNLFKTFKRIRQNSLRLLKTVNNLLQVSKIDSNYMQLNLVNIDIISFIQEIVKSITPYIENKNISVVFNTTLKEKIIAIDKDHMEKIILNLVSNAIKFSYPNGKINIRVSKDNDFIKISIKDNGMGISKEKQELLFEKFYQVNNSLKRSAEGTGLGLSIVKSLIDLHGGNIEVVSEPEMGTEFIIFIPDKIIDNKIEGNSISYQNFINPIDIEMSDL